VDRLCVSCSHSSSSPAPTPTTGPLPDLLRTDELYVESNAANVPSNDYRQFA
jgi:hypothetical protein